MDETGKYVPIGAAEFVAPSMAEPETEKLEITPELVKQCEDRAREFICDITNLGKQVPIRFLFSGLLEKPFTTGFEGNSFIAQERDGLDVESAYSLTRNEATTTVLHRNFFRHATSFFEKKSDGWDYKDDKTNEELEEIIMFIKEKSPDLWAEIEETSTDSPCSTRYARISDTIFLRDKDRHVANLTEMRSVLGNDDPELTDRVILNNYSGKPVSEWTFEEKELFYEKVMPLIHGSFMRGDTTMQFYDCALAIDSDKITESKHGYLIGDEKEITAPSDSILGSFPRYCPMDKGAKPGSYVTEKLKRTYYHHPELSRPLYSSKGDVLWPPIPEDQAVSSETPSTEEPKDDGDKKD